MELSELEQDLLGDFAQDAHGLWEVFEFVRHHRPSLSEPEVLEAGREFLGTWLARGWLMLDITERPRQAIGAIEELLPLVDRLGQEATRPFEGAPQLQLSDRAYEDVPWLRGAV